MGAGRYGGTATTARPPPRRLRYRYSDTVDPTNGTHDFTPKVVRLEAMELHCLECGNPLTTGLGLNTARHGLAAREVASALVRLASWATYAEASQAADGVRAQQAPARR